jgi:hypothetical protein
VETLKAALKTLLFPLHLAGVFLALALVPSVDLVPMALAAGGGNLGHVSRIQGAASAEQGGAVHPLALHTMVQRGDVLKTGPGARLELTLLDETRLTLGADTEFVLERYDLGRQQGAGAVLLKLAKGAFRLATGELSALRGGPFEVGTPLGVIGIRGTDFWGGYITAEGVSVMLISGKGVYVVNEAGRSEIVNPGDGVELRSRLVPPTHAIPWSPAVKAKAYQMVGFD